MKATRGSGTRGARRTRPEGAVETMVVENAAWMKERGTPTGCGRSSLANTSGELGDGDSRAVKAARGRGTGTAWWTRPEGQQGRRGDDGGRST